LQRFAASCPLHPPLDQPCRCHYLGPVPRRPLRSWVTLQQQGARETSSSIGCVQAVHGIQVGSRAQPAAAVGEKRSRSSAGTHGSSTSASADTEASTAVGSAPDRRSRLAAALSKPKRAPRGSAALPDSRVDFMLTSDSGALTFVEVKSVTLAEPCAASTSPICTAPLRSRVMRIALPIACHGSAWHKKHSSPVICRSWR
jgi:Sugar fermentation stimulation protein RE domain